MPHGEAERPPFICPNSCYQPLVTLAVDLTILRLRLTEPWNQLPVTDVFLIELALHRILSPKMDEKSNLGGHDCSQNNEEKI